MNDILNDPVLCLSYVMYVIPCIVALIGIWVEVPRKPLAKLSLTVFTILLVVVSVRCKILEHMSFSSREAMKDSKIDSLQSDNANLKLAMDYLVSVQRELTEEVEFDMAKDVASVSLPMLGSRLVVNVHRDGRRTLVWDDGENAIVRLYGVVCMNEADVKIMSAHTAARDYDYVVNRLCHNGLFAREDVAYFWDSEYRDGLLTCPALLARRICDVVQLFCSEGGKTYRVDESCHVIKVSIGEVSAPVVEQKSDMMEISYLDGVATKWLVVNDRTIQDLAVMPLGLFGNRVVGLLPDCGVVPCFRRDDVVRMYEITSEKSRTIHCRDLKAVPRKYWVGPNK